MDSVNVLKVEEPGGDKGLEVWYEGKNGIEDYA